MSDLYLAKDSIEKHGYFIFKNSYTEKEIQSVKRELNRILDNSGSERRCGLSHSVSFDRKSDLYNLIDNFFLENIKQQVATIDKTLAPTRAHSHRNIPSTWHRDIKCLNFLRDNIFRYFFGEKNIKKGPSFCRAAIYMQDHKDNNQGLWIVPGSHKGIGFFSGYLSLFFGKTRYLESKIGDVIVFDLRLLHRGWRPPYYFYIYFVFSNLIRNSGKKSKYLKFLRKKYSESWSDKISLFITFSFLK